MAAAIKTILKLTNTEAVIKISGGAGDTSTITLNTDLLNTGKEVLSGVAPKVNVTSLMVSGAITGVGSIDRAGVRIMSLTAQSGFVLDFTGGQTGFVADSQQNTADLLVTLSGGETQAYIYLKKVAGYTSSDYLTAASS